jgi:hypothetical protein
MGSTSAVEPLSTCSRLIFLIEEQGTIFVRLRFSFGCVAFAPHPPHLMRRSRSQILKSEAMNTEKFEDHREEWRTLWLAIAGVMAITLTWNVLMLSLNGISY